MRLRTLATSLALVAITTQSGCFGSFGLTKKIYQFNDGVSDSMVVKEVVFLALIILPVYELAALGDAVIFNLIEFLTGSNPLADARLIEADGRSVAFERHAKGIDVVVEEADGTLVRHTFRRHKGTWEVIDADGNRVALLEHGPDGSVTVVDAVGEPLAMYSSDHVDHLVASAFTGGWESMVAGLRPTFGPVVAAR